MTRINNAVVNRPQQNHQLLRYLASFQSHDGCHVYSVRDAIVSISFSSKRETQSEIPRRNRYDEVGCMMHMKLQDVNRWQAIISVKGYHEVRCLVLLMRHQLQGISTGTGRGPGFSQGCRPKWPLETSGSKN